MVQARPRLGVVVVSAAPSRLGLISLNGTAATAGGRVPTFTPGIGEDPRARSAGGFFPTTATGLPRVGHLGTHAGRLGSPAGCHDD